MKKVTVYKFHTRQRDQYHISFIFLKILSEDVVTDLQYFAGSINVCIIQDIQPYPAKCLLFFDESDIF